MALILMIEDNPDNRDLFQVYLEHVGHTVLTAGDAESGIRLARERLPDLILMDVGLPRMNGLQATRILKTDPATQHIQVVALTAHAMVSDEQEAIDAGCDRYISKPVLPRDLADAIAEQLGSSGGGGDAPP